MREAPRVYLVNVGANSSHALRSPLFPDGSFELVPIPEGSRLADCLPHQVAPITFADLRCSNTDAPLLSLFPARLRARYADVLAHYDPRLENGGHGAAPVYSYGDVPRLNARARALVDTQPGDVLFFLVNLAPFNPDAGTFVTLRGSFYCIGYLEVAAVLEYAPGADRLQGRFGQSDRDLAAGASNAHVIQRLVLPGRYADVPFTVFEGTERSRRLGRAVPLTKEVCERCLRDRNGEAFVYARFRSLESCIGCYTRSVRAHFDLAKQDDRVRFDLWMEHVSSFGEVPISDSPSR